MIHFACCSSSLSRACIDFSSFEMAPWTLSAVNWDFFKSWKPLERMFWTCAAVAAAGVFFLSISSSLTRSESVVHLSRSSATSVSALFLASRCCLISDSSAVRSAARID